MSDPRQNAQAVADGIAKVRAHCMCLRFEDQSEHYFVRYPEGFRLAGCRVSKGMGLAAALRKLLERMEQHWLEGAPRA